MRGTLTFTCAFDQKIQCSALFARLDHTLILLEMLLRHALGERLEPGRCCLREVDAAGQMLQKLRLAHLPPAAPPLGAAPARPAVHTLCHGRLAACEAGGLG